MSNLLELKEEFRQLINVELPFAYTKPIHFNHCFNRVILDWLFKDCWYVHLDKNKTALHQLSAEQLHAAILRMRLWLSHHEVLIEDNLASLKYRKTYKIAQLGIAKNFLY